MAPLVILSVERAKAALREVMSAFSLPDNISKLSEAKANAGNDMLLYMQLVFPITTQIQLDVIQNYGFPGEAEGIIQFSQALKQVEKESQEVKQLNNEVRALLIPQMTLPYMQNTTT